MFAKRSFLAAVVAELTVVTPAPAADLAIEVTGIRSDKGRIAVSVAP